MNPTRLRATAAGIIAALLLGLCAACSDESDDGCTGDALGLAAVGKPGPPKPAAKPARPHTGSKPRPTLKPLPAKTNTPHGGVHVEFDDCD